MPVLHSVCATLSDKKQILVFYETVLIARAVFLLCAAFFVLLYSYPSDRLEWSDGLKRTNGRTSQ